MKPKSLGEGGAQSNDMINALKIGEDRVSIRHVQERFSTHKRSASTSALAVASSFCMRMTMRIFVGFPTSRSPVHLALRSELNRMVTMKLHQRLGHKRFLAND